MIRIFTIAALLQFGFMNAQSPWPSVSWSTATNLTAVMDADGITDLSGLHWNPDTNRLYCVQGDGHLHVLQLDTATNTFTQIANIAVPDGPEGITQVDYSANEFYTIDENNYEIRKFTHNATFGSMAESKHWNLLAPPSPMTDTGNTGPEGIVFVPDGALTAIGFISQQTGALYTSVKGMGGLMFIAHQDQGYIWVFDVNPNTNNDFAYVGKYHTNRLESCDLAFDRTTGMLYILHNIGSNYLEVTDLSSIVTSGTERKFVTKSEYFISNPLENINIEGFALTPKCPGNNTVSAWLCRDAESNESDFVRHDVLRWFNPFFADGTCAPLSTGEMGNHIKEFSVLPNPGNSNIRVSFSGSEIQNGSIRIINNLGQVVMKIESCNGSVFNFDISALQSGLYFIEVRQEQGVSEIKWIKN